MDGGSQRSDLWVTDAMVVRVRQGSKIESLFGMSALDHTDTDNGRVPADAGRRFGQPDPGSPLTMDPWQ